ncbi:MAG: hypothetical protein JNL98_27250 [Bryobacterales bacterium]|nr:hypothetical protein [Bryobacterales bacterium]
MIEDISEYRRWKQQGEALRARAKQSLETRFRECLMEAMQIAEEYRDDFGAPLKPPAMITAFRYKATPKKGAKKPAKPSAAAKADAPAPAAPPAPAAKPDPKVAELQKKLAAAKKKLEAAKAGGGATKNLEDRIYEIEDDLRLASGRAQ